ncbi:hypothetical protein MMC21_002463 [Puttea exsequens]|nr:hypothetical protein [Puttea exsequens]
MNATELVQKSVQAHPGKYLLAFLEYRDRTRRFNFRTFERWTRDLSAALRVQSTELVVDFTDITQIGGPIGADRLGKWLLREIECDNDEQREVTVLVSSMYEGRSLLKVKRKMDSSVERVVSEVPGEGLAELEENSDVDSSE